MGTIAIGAIFLGGAGGHKCNFMSTIADTQLHRCNYLGAIAWAQLSWAQLSLMHLPVHSTFDIIVFEIHLNDAFSTKSYLPKHCRWNFKFHCST